MKHSSFLFPFRLREGSGEGLSLAPLFHPLPRPHPQAEGEK